MRRVFLLIYRMVGNVADAQDLTQEAFIKALQRQDQLKGSGQGHALAVAYLHNNTAIDRQAVLGRVSFRNSTRCPGRWPVSAMENPEQMMLRTKRRECLGRAWTFLTDGEQTALLLRDVEDLPAEQVAERLSCSKATVRSHIANARVKLRKHFARLQKRGLA